jgi:hypothetical protein
MNKKKERKEKQKKRRKIINKDFFRAVPDNPPEGVFISNAAWFHEK